MSGTRETSVKSTPAKHKTAARNASQVANNTVKAIFDDVAHDVKHAEKAGFDSFLRLFISRSLVGDKKAKFDELQQSIEKLQAHRYNDVASRQTPREALNTDERETNTDGDGRAPVLEEEKSLVAERDELLEGVLQHCLQQVLAIANDTDIRGKLKIFAKLVKRKSGETERYKPYVELYNAALAKLETAPNFPLREEASHHLRISRADPRAIKSTFAGTRETLERKPDLVRTSQAAAHTCHGETDETLGDLPKKAFEWSQVLSCEEMKAFKAALSPRAQKIYDGQQFADIGDAPAIPWDEEYKFAEDTTPEDASQVISSTKSGSKRAISEALGEGVSSNKKPRLNSTAAASSAGTDKAPPPKDPTKYVDARVQLATYAMEQLSSGPGVAHVIGTLVVDEYLYICYYDRQGIISSEGISIIADFPRFLVLLLAFQRFEIEDWGVVPCLNPKALAHLRSNISSPSALDLSEVTLPLKGNHFSGPPEVISEIDPEKHLVINSAKYLSSQPHCIAGRATSVFMATHNGKDVACKISSPEVQRFHEGDTLRTIRAIADAKDPSMLVHLPELYFSGDLQAGSTLRARSILGLCGKGYRALRLIVLEVLLPLTSQSGKSFVDAWLDAVTCHAFLWKHGVEHSDPSLWNVMYHPIRKCGVLTDFDLTVFAWLTRVPGNDRTGTIPFMALELLQDRYWTGNITRRYHHELEAFMWMLPFVFLAYDDGKFDRKAPFVVDWMTSDHNTCSEKKLHFAIVQLNAAKNMIKAAFKDYEHLMRDTCRMIRLLFLERRNEAEDLAAEDLSYQEGLPNYANVSPPALFIEHCAAMWEEFLSVLLKQGIDTTRLRKHRPVFEPALNQDLFDEMKGIHHSNRRMHSANML